MISRPQPKGIPAELRSEVAMLAAVGREALLECHVRHAVELVELGRGRVTPERMLEIYASLHFVEPEQARDVRAKALAALGERALRYAVVARLPDAPGPPPPTTLWGRLRARIHPRVYHALRRQVERHTGRTEINLMELHAEHALRFVRLLESRLNVAHSVRVYAETIGLRETLRETLYLLVLSRLGDAAPETPVYGGASEVPAAIAATQ